MSDPFTEADIGQDSVPAPDAGFDSYQSLAYPDIRIFVVKDVVPPFRFKAGGWELLESSTELGFAMKARVAERGYFLYRVNEDQTGGVELSDFPPSSPQRIV